MPRLDFEAAAAARRRRQQLCCHTTAGACLAVLKALFSTGRLGHMFQSSLDATAAAMQAAWQAAAALPSPLPQHLLPLPAFMPHASSACLPACRCWPLQIINERRPFLPAEALRRGTANFGSGQRFERLGHKLLAGKPITVAFLGGSITWGRVSLGPFVAASALPRACLGACDAGGVGCMRGQVGGWCGAGVASSLLRGKLRGTCCLRCCSYAHLPAGRL